MLKTTTNWNELTVWWSWACSPQTHWCLRTDHFSHPVTSRSTNWRTVPMLTTYPVNPLPDLAFIMLCWNPWGVPSFGRHEPPISLPGPTINLSLLQTPTFWYWLASLCVRHTNVYSVTYPKLDKQTAQNLQQARPHCMPTLPEAPLGTGPGGLKHLWGCGSELPEKGNQLMAIYRVLRETEPVLLWFDIELDKIG